MIVPDGLRATLERVLSLPRKTIKLRDEVLLDVGGRTGKTGERKERY
jgi:hypothetical protein